jgi:hypothetical protein
MPPRPSPSPFIWTHLERPDGASASERADVCTPYTAELIVDEALRAGRGGVLEVVVAAGSDDAVLARVQKYFARLPARGVAVDVRTQERAA